ncbi:MAG: T9SS type A sorting domain-containing protein [Flavobacteriales bacterium]|nr:T9SS type A sorting domain-containing protein [Flavobacteriales bacterium]
MRQRVLIVLFGALIAGHTRAVWTNMNTGINDDLTGVWFWGTKGVVCGEHGIYYTTTGGIGPSSWTRFDIPGSPADDAKYDRTKFTAVGAIGSVQDVALFCGTDTVNQVAIIMKVDIVAQTYDFVYTGTAPSALNDIRRASSTRVLAVGNEGLFLESLNGGTTFTPVVSGTTADLFCIASTGPSYSAGGVGVLVEYAAGTATPQPCPYDLHAIAGSTNGPHSGVGESFYSLDYGFSESRTYDPWPLDGRDMAKSSYIWVATSNGIYRGPTFVSYLELQPYTEGFAFDDLMFTGSQGYAAGDQGVLLQTPDGGAYTIPYSAIITDGGCVGMEFDIEPVTGTGGCEWFLNGAPLHTGCGDFTTTIPTAGSYSLMLTSSNSFTTDTSEVLLAIVDTPLIDLPISGLDTVLCKEEPLSFSIASTQNNVLYLCLDITNGEIIGSANGTGGTIFMTTDTVRSTADLVFVVRNTIVTGCERTFTDTIHVRVEETRARFHADLINATSIEDVNFYSVCTDAQHFAWSFGAGASPASSSLEDPSGIQFSAPGQTTIQLICWSDHGCYDTVTAPGAFIYSEPVPSDSCWAMQVHGADASWPGYHSEKISEAVDTGDGFLICGTSHDQSLPSRIGNGIPLWPDGGVFLAKYSYAGVLKWTVYAADELYLGTNLPRPNIHSVCVTPNGYIVIAGKLNAHAWIKMNNGDSVQLSNLNYDTFVAELGPRGDYHWNGWFVAATPRRVSADASGNIAVSGDIKEDYGYYVRGSTTYPFGAIGIPLHQQWSFLMKLDPTGTPLWQTFIEYEHVNGATIEDMAMDTSGNIFLAGEYEHSIRYRSANGGPDFYYERAVHDYGSWLYACKYDPAGQFLWSINAEDSVGHSVLYGVVPDNAGGCYVTGKNTIYPPWDPHMYVGHSDGSFTLLEGSGSFMVARLDASGHFVWNNGTVYANNAASGMGIHLNGSGVFAGGVASEGANGWSGMISSSIGQGLPLWVGRGDYFIASYSPAGELQDLFVPGPSPSLMGGTSGSLSIFSDTLGHVFMAGDLDSPLGVLYYLDLAFATTLADEYDGIIAKFGSTPCFNVATTSGSLTPTGPSLSIYPNPAATELHVLLPEGNDWRLSIVDVLGRRTVPIERASGNHVILSRASLPIASGPIVIVAESNGQQLLQKVMLMEP